MAGWQEDDVEPENEAVVRVKIGSVADSAKAFQSKPKGKKNSYTWSHFATLSPGLFENNVDQVESSC